MMDGPAAMASQTGGTPSGTGGAGFLRRYVLGHLGGARGEHREDRGETAAAVEVLRGQRHQQPLDVVDEAVGPQHRVRPRDRRGAHQHPLVPVRGELQVLSGERDPCGRGGAGGRPGAPARVEAHLRCHAICTRTAALLPYLARDRPAVALPCPPSRPADAAQSLCPARPDPPLWTLAGAIHPALVPALQRESIYLRLNGKKSRTTVANLKG
jgi:hypothetical protein